VHRPYAAPHRDRGGHQPYATRKSPGRPDTPAEIEGGVRREGSDQNGQSNEIRIVCSGNDHRDRPDFRTRDQWTTYPRTLQVYSNPSPGAIDKEFATVELKDVKIETITEATKAAVKSSRIV
jgi:hypothetical protein